MRNAPGHAGSGSLLLGLLALGAAGLLLLARAARQREEGAPACAAGACAAPWGAGPTAAQAGEPLAGEREALAARGPRPAAAVDARAQAPAARGARKEREVLAGFLELEHEHPGALEERAAAVIEGDGPAAEKVAMLRALGEGEPGPHLRWLEHAVRSLPDESGPEGVSVARYALDELVAAARAEREARAVLARVAFEVPELAPSLRRTAAAGLARDAAEPELQGLRAALAREDDEQLVAGVVAALRDRQECPPAAWLAQEFQAGETARTE